MKNDKPTGAMLREVARLLLQLQRAYVSSCAGTTSTQCFILSEVGRGGPLTLSDLGRRLALDKGWVSRAVESLDRGGFLDKRPGESDKRTVVISLSRKGKARYTELNRLLDQQSADVLRRVPGKERPAIYDALKRLHRALQDESKIISAKTSNSRSPREFQGSRKRSRRNKR